MSKPPSPDTPASQWSSEGCILDMDYFVQTITGIKSKGVRPDLIGSIIAHYSSKWLPDHLEEQHHQSATASWLKKRFFVETLVGLLPHENDAVPCAFLLRLLRLGSMLGLDPDHADDLERRVSRQLDQADLPDLLIPSFTHTSATLLDVHLFTRLLNRFLRGPTANAAALPKVARLVDDYLAEAAVDAAFALPDFIDLAAALPPHVRATHDGLYRAIDTYLKYKYIMSDSSGSSDERFDRRQRRWESENTPIPVLPSVLIGMQQLTIEDLREKVKAADLKAWNADRDNKKLSTQLYVMQHQAEMDKSRITFLEDANRGLTQRVVEVQAENERLVKTFFE